MNNKPLVISALVVLLFIGIGIWAFNRGPETGDTTAINDFEDCVLAGYPVMESFPRRCSTPDGRTFTENTNKQVVRDGCYIGGCSQQICSGEPDVASTCEYREEYACYQTATCEKQSDGNCGWTQDLGLTTCLNVVLYPDANLK